ncbi:MAG: signal peptidase I [Lachnospiraceae bacterium]|nr:signal peptidase I [Lachnospiraceae bacterium]
MKVGPSKKNAGSLSFRRRRKKIEKEKIGGAFLLLAEIAAVAALAFVIVWFFGYRVRMTGQSMETGISDGDYLLLNKTAYLIHGPKRGDIIAFYPSGNPNANPTIKRVMGLPGDRMKVEDGYLYINGEEYKGKPDYKGIDDPGVLASEITLGEDDYFVIGDNISASEDSRFTTIGYISKSDIIGSVWWNLSFPNVGVPN